MTTRSRPEAILERQVLAVLGQDRDLAIFRNECGSGYHSRAGTDVLAMLHLAGRPDLAMRASEILNRARVHFGLHNGSADLCGVLGGAAGGGGRFVSFELKSERGSLRPEQALWQARMRALGAVAEVVRSPGEAALFIDEARRGQR